MSVEGEVNVSPVAREVQIPIELSPILHRQLARWCRETAELLDTAGVGRGEVIEALIDQLVEDPLTGEAVRRRLFELAGYRPPATTEPPSARWPARGLDGFRPSPTLTRRVGSPSTTLAAVPVPHIGHPRSAAGRPAHLTS